MKVARSQEQTRLLSKILSTLGRSFQALMLHAEPNFSQYYPAPRRLWFVPPLLPSPREKIFGTPMREISKAFYAHPITLEEVELQWQEAIRSARHGEGPPDTFTLKRMYRNFSWTADPPAIERIIQWLYLTHCSLDSELDMGKTYIMVNLNGVTFGVYRSTLVWGKDHVRIRFGPEKSVYTYLQVPSTMIEVGDPYLCATYDLLQSGLPVLKNDIDFVTAVVAGSGVSTSFTDYFFSDFMQRKGVYGDEIPEQVPVGYKVDMRSDRLRKLQAKYYTERKDKKKYNAPIDKEESPEAKLARQRENEEAEEIMKIQRILGRLS